MEILYKSKNAVVVYKPPLIPSQPDPSGDEDIMTMTAGALRALGENDKLWLVHRLDRVVGGVMAFARNPAAAAELSAVMSNHEVVCKQYLAVVDGKITDGIMEDYIFKDRLSSKAYITDRERGGVKRCCLSATTLATAELGARCLSLLRVSLYTGRFHQIRAQLSHRGSPIVGDKKYGSRDKEARIPALFAYRLDIKLKNERITVEMLPDINAYPWSCFANTLLQTEGTK